MRRWSLSLVAACALSTGADASNSSSVREIGIEVQFIQCTHLEGQEVADAQFCGEETWVIHVAADGWQSEHENVVRAIPNRWTATCSEGAYRAVIDSKVWSGACGINGDQARLCFETQSTTGPGDFGGEQMQCFELSEDACRMDLQGKVWQNGVAGEIVNRYAVSSRNVTACRILEE